MKTYTYFCAHCDKIIYIHHDKEQGHSIATDIDGNLLNIETDFRAHGRILPKIYCSDTCYKENTK